MKDTAVILAPIMFAITWWVSGLITYVTGVVIAFQTHFIIGLLALVPIVGCVFGLVDIVSFGHLNLPHLLFDSYMKSQGK